MVAPLYTTASGLLFHAGKIVILTIGLPARGKTHISRALERYLRWMGIKTLVVLGGAQKVPPDYFSPGEKRRRSRTGCEKLIWDYFDNGGQVVIYDANNGRKETRDELARKFEDRGIHVVMLESLCDNRDIIEANIRSNHEQYYETIDPEDTTWPFIKILNVGEKITLNGIQGYLQSRIVFFLMNIHNRFRTIYFARSGQSLIEHSYKADSDLLKDYVLERRAKSLEARGLVPSERKLVIWTSTRRRAHHTAWPFVAATTGGAQSMPIPQLTPPLSLSLLTIICKVYLSMGSPKAILAKEEMEMEKGRQTPPVRPRKPSPPLPSRVKAKKYYPLDWKRFTKDPYSYRAPRAESYHDLSVRLEPILIELEREQEDLLIIGHASVIRCLLAYLIGLPPAEIPAIEIARGDLLEVVPTSYGVHSHAFHFWDGPGRSHEGASGVGGAGARRRAATGAHGELGGEGEDEDEEGLEGAGGGGGVWGHENYAEDTKGKRKVVTDESLLTGEVGTPSSEREVEVEI
ncbi:cytoplasmic protein [Coprinopsis sp. MPI-PUGE-AT-0042]|nr:cytoplasmic protein [Coprinopsis sp. MPI-PUGE-AT-0042]